MDWFRRRALFTGLPAARLPARQGQAGIFLIKTGVLTDPVQSRRDFLRGRRSAAGGPNAEVYGSH